MYTIEMEYEQVDAIVKDVLKDDYKSICKNIEELRNKEDLAPFEQEDLNFDLKIRDAMRVVFQYYFSEREQEEIIGLTNIPNQV